MRDYNLQTPQKDQSVANRRSKSVSDQHKKAQKIRRKNLNSEFSAFSEEAPKDLIDFTSISELEDENLLAESAENFTASLSPATSLGSDALASSDLTHLSSTTTSDDHKEGLALTNQSKIGRSCSIEAELVVKHLREAQLQILNARDMDLQSKRVLDALVNLVVEEFIQLPEEKDQFNDLVVRKGNFLLMSFFLWILLVSAIFFIFSASQRSFSGAIPT
ncbi:hypothetical protein ACH5RR_030996 [Cinchona calisaya]|uniref:Uncharacterized protein n=1 Tax=Cinchona calisaya TaxID=153742 RepID=A0ABD2YHX2_9GENT